MKANINELKYGQSYDVADILNFQEVDHNGLVSALINAMSRINKLELAVQVLESHVKRLEQATNTEGE